MHTGILVRIHNQSRSRSTVTGAELQPERQPVAAASHSLQPATPTEVFVKESHIVMPPIVRIQMGLHYDKVILYE